MTRARHNFGFTLIELILVMMILTVVMSIAAPRVSGWGKGNQLRRTADDFVAATRWARSRAAADGATYTIEISSQAFSIPTSPAVDQSKLVTPFREPIAAPEGGRIQAVSGSDGRTPIESIRFYPTGRVDPAIVRISSVEGAIQTIQCLTPADDFARVIQETP